LEAHLRVRVAFLQLLRRTTDPGGSHDDDSKHGRLQEATLQQYLIDYQNTVLKAQKEVEDGISSFVQSRAVVAFPRKSVDAAKGALKIATLEYQQGTRDFTAVLLAEQNLLQAENNLAVATGEVSLGLTAIFRALGGGWQIRNDSYFV
jgi:outer membrane protein TolC